MFDALKRALAVGSLVVTLSLAAGRIEIFLLSQLILIHSLTVHLLILENVDVLSVHLLQLIAINRQIFLIRGEKLCFGVFGLCYLYFCLYVLSNIVESRTFLWFHLQHIPQHMHQVRRITLLHLTQQMIYLLFTYIVTDFTQTRSRK